MQGLDHRWVLLTWYRTKNRSCHLSDIVDLFHKQPSILQFSLALSDKNRSWLSLTLIDFCIFGLSRDPDAEDFFGSFESFNSEIKDT